MQHVYDRLMLEVWASECLKSARKGPWLLVGIVHWVNFTLQDGTHGTTLTIEFFEFQSRFDKQTQWAHSDSEFLSALESASFRRRRHRRPDRLT